MLKNLNATALGPKRLVQTLLGVAVLVLVLGVAVIFLMNARMHAMQAVVTNKESQVGSNEQIARRYEQTQADYDKVAAQTQYLEASVSAKAFVPTLLKQLQVLATTTHLTVTSVHPGQITSPTPPAGSTTAADGTANTDGVTKKKAPPAPYDTIDIGVDVSGTYPDTAAFLYGLTKFPKIISVASVQMAPGTANPSAAQTGVATAQTVPMLTTNMHLTAFVFHEDSAAPAGLPTPDAGLTAPATAQAAPGHSPAAAFASPFPVRPEIRSTGAVTEAASHAASRAIGADKAARARSEAGVETL